MQQSCMEFLTYTVQQTCIVYGGLKYTKFNVLIYNEHVYVSSHSTKCNNLVETLYSINHLQLQN